MRAMKKLEGVIHTHRKNKVSFELAVSHQSFTTALPLFYLYHYIMNSKGYIIEAP